MEIYALYNDLKTVCISNDISKIRKIICDTSIFNPNESYPVLETWIDGTRINLVEGQDVLREIADTQSK